MRTTSLLTLGTAAAALAAAPLVAEAYKESMPGPEVSLSAEELLAPYYAKLEQSVELPVAPANASLAPDSVITRLAFGSCNHQSRSQHMWARIAETNPDLFLFIGDNNYGDQMWGAMHRLALCERPIV